MQGETAASARAGAGAAAICLDFASDPMAVRGGWIAVAATIDSGADGDVQALRFTVQDWGRPMPGGTLPDGTLPPSDEGGPPEGGFGWHLIRALASGLDYWREGGCNWFQFSLKTEQKPPIG